MVRSMTGDPAMPEDTDSPTFGLSEGAKDHPIRSHGVMHWALHTASGVGDSGDAQSAIGGIR